MTQNAETVIEEQMEIYAGPPHRPQPSSVPRSPENLAWSKEVEAARLGALDEMDRAVIDMIVDGFNRGFSVTHIKDRTKGCITWSEWPREYDNLDGEPRGIYDRRLSEEEWARPENSVVVIHQSYRAPNGVEYHYLQNTFRNRIGKDVGNRPCVAFYLVIISEGGLEQERLWRVSQYTHRLVRGDGGYTPKLLGFVEPRQGDIPGVLVYTGVYGTAHVIDPYYFRWLEEIERWERIHMGPQRQASYVTYDPDTTELQCYYNRDGLHHTWNLNATLVEDKEHIDKHFQRIIDGAAEETN